MLRLRQFQRVPTVYALSKDIKNIIFFFPMKIFNFYNFWNPKFICTSNSRAFKTKHFDINLMKFGGLIRKL